MMTQAFYTGLSGLKNSSYGIDIISDDLANVNTSGYRGNTYEFSSLFEDALVTTDGSTDDAVGLGTSIQATSMVQSSGTYQLTDRNTDLAIVGDGWFGVQSSGEPQYTRDGAFGFDVNSDLVTADGFYLLGTMGGNIDANTLTQPMDEVPLGDVSTQTKLTFPNSLIYPSQPTTNVKFTGNLGTDNTVKTMSSEVIDSTGNRNELKLEFSLVEPQTFPGTQWDVTAKTKGLGDDSVIYDTQSGVVKFDESGTIVSSTLSTIDNNGTPIDIDLGSGFTGLVSISNLDVSASSFSDGSMGGELEGYNINQNGDVIATFTNGKQSSVGKVAVYHFQNDQGLERISGTRFSRSSNSGDPIFYKDETGQNIVGSTISSYQLEGSNVDMTYGLTELIILQRSYDANSKSITTADEMMQKALDMDA